MASPGVLLAVVWGLTELCFSAPTDGISTICCFSYQQRPIPRNLITSAYTTSRSCSQPGVILVTKKGREICVDPQAAWVKAHLKHFEKEN
uniref:Chemokine interleukin-8-like domain-containing protein n=1 Tax=Cairina moschata TaxID=8855 RepID=A0A8C3CVL4_CAIMO